jgi:hypothetical protein
LVPTRAYSSIWGSSWIESWKITSFNEAYSIFSTSGPSNLTNTLSLFNFYNFSLFESHQIAFYISSIFSFNLLYIVSSSSFISSWPPGFSRFWIPCLIWPRTLLIEGKEWLAGTLWSENN